MPMYPKWGKKIPIFSSFGRSQESTSYLVGSAFLGAGNRCPRAQSQEGAGMAGVISVSIQKRCSRPCHNHIKVFP